MKKVQPVSKTARVGSRENQVVHLKHVAENKNKDTIFPTRYSLDRFSVLIATPGAVVSLVDW